VGAKEVLGRWGEQVVADYLLQAGWQLLDRNWRGVGGELDLVARDGSTIVVVEVKTRSGPRFGHPAEAVTSVKLARLRRLAGQWLSQHSVAATDVRIDVVAVRSDKSADHRVEHLRGVV
jgi:putative endonuclease